MNIAFVSDFCTPYTTGGVERRYYELSQYLLSKGHTVTWFTSRQWDGADEHVIDGIRIRSISGRFHTYKGNRYSGDRRSIAQALIFGFWSLRLLFVRDRYDVVDMSQYPLFHIVVGAVYERIRKTPVIYSWYEFWGDHWLEYLRGSHGYVGKFLERFMARIPGDKIVVSEQLMSRLTERGCDPGSLHYVPNWIDYDHILNLPALGPAYDVCYFGRLKDHKNIDVLLRAVALCRDQGLVLKTKILGQGPERRKLHKLAQDLKLDDQVEFLGRVENYDELLGYVKSASLCVNPSTKEGGGSITCLEAHACGLPVVAVDHPLGLDKSLIVEQENGYWAMNATPPALAATMRLHFASNSVQRDLMGQRAIAGASQYSSQELCQRIEGIYAQLSHARVNRNPPGNDVGASA